MTPKKAIIIILIFLLIIVVIFSILFFNKKQTVVPNNGLNTNQVEQTQTPESTNATNTIQQKIDKIIENSKNSSTSTPDTVRQEIIGTVNAEIIEQEQSKTPEQKAADLKAQEERQKVIDQINNQIKQKTNTVK